MYYRASDLKPDPKWSGCPVLKDEDGSIARVVSGSNGMSPAPPGNEELLDLQQRFWTWCWYVFGKVSRGELWEAVDGLHGIRTLALLPLMDWNAQRRHEGYRRLEKKLDPQMLGRLEATLAPPRAEALHAALLESVSLFRELRAPLFEECGLPLDSTPERLILDEMERRRAGLFRGDRELRLPSRAPLDKEQ
jgi:hypothetical protein